MAKNRSSASAKSSEEAPSFLEIFRSLPGMYLVLSPEMVVIAASDAYLQATQTHRENILNQHILEAFSSAPNSSPIVAVENLYASLQQAISSRRLHKMALIHKILTNDLHPDSHADQFWRPVNTPVFNEQGALTHIIHELTNSTESVLAERRLKESLLREQAALMEAEEQRASMHNILMGAPAAIALFSGPRHVFQLANPVYQRMVGKRSLLNKPIREALPELSGQSFLSMLDSVYKTGESVTVREMKVSLDRNGNGQLEEGYFNINWQPIFSPEGNIDGVLAFGYEVTEQVKAREKVEQSTALLELALKAGNMATFSFDVVRQIVTRSANHDQLLGYDENQPKWNLDTLLKHILNEDQPIVQEQLSQAFASGILNMEIRIKRLDGQMRWIRNQGKVFYEHGQAVQVAGVMMDITEQKLAEEAVKRSAKGEKEARDEAVRQQQRLESFFMQAPIGICILDGPEFVYELVNPTYQQLLPGRELIGKTVIQAIPEAVNSPRLEILKRVYRTGETYEGREVRFPLALQEGGPLIDRYINFIYQARHDAKGEIDGILAYALDVTNQVVARRQVELILDSMAQITWTANREGEATYLNKFWYNYTGADKSDTSNLQLATYLHPEDSLRQLEHWKKSIDTGQVLEIEVRVRRISDGVYRWHINRAVPIRNTASEIIMWVGTATDIHEQKLAEQALQTLSQELAASNEKLTASNQGLATANEQLKHINIDLDNFIYTASHDLKAPIHNIESLLNILMSQLPPESLAPEQVKRITNMIQESVERFKKTIANLTEVTKLQRETKQDHSLIPVKQVVKDILLDLELMIEASGVQLELDIEGSPAISMSEKNLRSVIYNLISNAIKYRSPLREPQVRLSCREEKEYIVLSVQDNGLGLDPRQKQKLFTMFERLHNHVEGSGVGLYMVKRIIENAGGKIEVESQPDVGSTFTVYFKQ